MCVSFSDVSSTTLFCKEAGNRKESVGSNFAANRKNIHISIPNSHNVYHHIVREEGVFMSKKNMVTTRFCNSRRPVNNNTTEQIR